MKRAFRRATASPRAIEDGFVQHGFGTRARDAVSGLLASSPPLAGESRFLSISHPIPMFGVRRFPRPSGDRWV